MASKEQIEDPTIPLQLINGFPLPGPPFVLNTVKDVLSFKPTPGDIFIVTYPKCGTTWTQFIVWEILNGGLLPPNPRQMILESIPFLEITGIEALDKLSHPRAMKTHLPFHLNPYSPSAKYIYVIRNPWDVCVSYYHHSLLDPAMKKANRTFDHFFEYFITGQVPYGDYFEHLLSWYEHKDDSNVLIIAYEDMKKDSHQVLFQIAEFLGKDYLNTLKGDAKMVENCLKYSNFDYLKERGLHFTDDVENARQGRDKVNFFRKGIVGDWKNYFSEDQIKRFSVYMKHKLEGTMIEDFLDSLRVSKD